MALAVSEKKATQAFGISTKREEDEERTALIQWNVYLLNLFGRTRRENTNLFHPLSQQGKNGYLV